jgi:hypothetical protein
MMNYIVHNADGKILSTGSCSARDFGKQAGPGEFVMEGIADDRTQKIVGDKIVSKTPEEIAEDNPPVPDVPFEKQPAYITNEQWQELLERLDRLENPG